MGKNNALGLVLIAVGAIVTGLVIAYADNKISIIIPVMLVTAVLFSYGITNLVPRELLVNNETS